MLEALIADIFLRISAEILPLGPLIYAPPHCSRYILPRIDRINTHLDAGCEGLDVKDFPLFKDDVNVFPHLGTNQEVPGLQSVHRAKLTFILCIMTMIVDHVDAY